VSPDADHVYHLYVIRVRGEEERDALRDHLETRGVSTGIHYPVPVHSQKSYKELPCKFNPLPVTETTARRILSLPMFPEITDEQIETVVETVASFYQSSR